MNCQRVPAGSLLAVLLVTLAPRLMGQATPAAAPEPATDETVVLSPFVVDATEDADSYRATSTLAGTRVRTELKDVASSISVVTQQFLKDTGAHNAQDLLVYTANTEVGGLRGNYSGQGGNVIYNEPLTNPSSNTRVRGLDAADNSRDFFLTDIPFDSFNTGRVDLQRGPNSILFGVGSPAGIINSSLNQAGFATSYRAENVASSYGSLRSFVDFNQVLLSDQLAVRVAVLDDHQRYQQDPAFNNARRYYGALRYDPSIFKSDRSHTSFRANFERGQVRSNNPRTIPPDDQITPWFTSGTDAYGQPGLNRKTINQYAVGQGANSPFNNATFNHNFAQGRTYWPTPINYFNGSSSSKPGFPPDVISSIPTQVIVGEIPTGWAIDSSGSVAGPNQPGNGGNHGIGGLPNYQPSAISPFSHYASAFIPGGTYYASKVLTDPTVFDFYNNLLDGPNKREWQNWKSLNLALSQTFLDGRLGFEASFDDQSYDQGQVGFLGGENYGINVDVNEVLADGSSNPNVGRPYVANAAESGNSSSKTNRDSTRLTGFAEVRATDYLGESKLGKILGRHLFTGILALDHKEQTNVSWSQYAADPSWETLNNFDLSVKISNYRLFNWVDYIGPGLSGVSSPSNMGITNIKNVIAPGANTSVRWFDSHWNHPLDPAAAGYVDPNAAYTYFNSDTSVLVNSTQSNNPANYVGWRTAPVTWMNADNPEDFPSMVTGGARTKFRDKSQALVWQGYFLDDDLVATYGWRKDSIVNFATNAPIDSATSIAALDYSDDPTSRQTVDGQTRTWGLVYHVPKSIMEHLPADSSLSLYVNNSHNFKADAPRKNLAGLQIPNPDGETKEYGVGIGVMDDKISLRVTHYETTVHFATLNNDAIAGLGGLSYYLDLIPAWGYGYAASLQWGLDGKFGNTSLNGPGDTAGNTQWNYVARDAIVSNPNADLSVIGTPAGSANLPVATYGYTGTDTVTMNKIVDAWKNMPVPDSFYDFFGITGDRPDPAKARANGGKLYNGFSTPWTTGPIGVGGQQPSGAQNAKSTVDNISKGWEYELTAQPTKNWNLTVNYSRTAATKANIDPITTQFMADNLAFYQGPGGQLRLWGASQTAGYTTPTSLGTPGVTPPVYPFAGDFNNGSTVGPKWIAGVYNPYLVTALAAGQSAPEVAPWRLNLVTTYNFDHGFLKNSFVGGAARLEAGRILGYKLDPTTLVLDPTQELVGPNDKHYDLWLGYNAKFALSRDVRWRIQLNIRDVGQKSQLVPARYQPDGTLALARIQQGMTWQLTNSFEF